MAAALLSTSRSAAALAAAYEDDELSLAPQHMRRSQRLASPKKAHWRAPKALNAASAALSRPKRSKQRALAAAEADSSAPAPTAAAPAPGVGSAAPADGPPGLSARPGSKARRRAHRALRLAQQDQQPAELARQPAPKEAGGPRASAVAAAADGPTLDYRGFARALKKRSLVQAEKRRAQERRREAQEEDVASDAAAALGTAAVRRAASGPCRALPKAVRRRGVRVILPVRTNEIQTSCHWFSAPLLRERGVAHALSLSKTIDPRALPDTNDESTCAVCLGELLDEDEAEAAEPVVQLAGCTPHYFHRGCIASALAQSLRCPVCVRPAGPQLGTQPPGTMAVRTIEVRMPGFPCSQAIVITYNFPSGTQGKEHPSPGMAYSGTHRVAYLPMTAEGERVLGLLQRAWDQRLVFTVGTSVTTGTSNTVVWNGIHHKTNLHGGASFFGYPDDTYLARVTDELACFGIA